MKVGNRRTIVAWWIHYRLDSVDAGEVTPELLMEIVDEAEDDLHQCDRVLMDAYDEYIPQG